MTKIWFPFRLAFIVARLMADMRTNADDRLALELNVTCHRARLKQLVAENDGFYVATKADGVKLSENSSNRRLRRLAKHALQRQAAGYRPDPLPASAVN